MPIGAPTGLGDGIFIPRFDAPAYAEFLFQASGLRFGGQAPQRPSRAIPDLRTLRMLLFIYADESCLGNQFRDRARPGGAGGMLEYHHATRGWVRRDHWLSEPDTTNNRMALRSAIELLRALPKPQQVVFTSDSRYLVDGITAWVHGWAKRGWTRKGGEIENLTLWQDLTREAARHQVQWCWVKGHAGHPQNEYANFLATRAAAQQTASDGLAPSGFDAWMDGERRKGRYQSFLPPDPVSFAFKPAARPPTV